jgi:CO/xanthine dehydrogenase Mo-binding subunit
MNQILNVSRRDFLKAGAASSAALMLGFSVPACKNAAGGVAGASFSPNAFLKIDADDIITIWVNKTEMGQGVRTGIPMLLAEELDADWTKVRVETAMADEAKYGRQGTGGSGSIRSAWESFRKAGASARDMLLTAAAQTWSVPKAECKAENGFIVHPASGKKASYGSLAESASKLSVPSDPPMKDPKDYRIIGKPVKRIDGPPIVSGAAVYGLDARVPGMKFATVIHSPVFGGTPNTVDDTKAKTVTGVAQVVKMKTAVAVVANSTWAAFEGAKALAVSWNEGETAKLTSAGIRAMFEEKGKSPGETARKDGDFTAAFGGAAKKLEAVYEVPYLNHATMEPMNCVADVRSGSCEVWAPTQFPDRVVAVAKEITGLDAAAVKVHITLLGGGFGRRIENDYAADAIELSKLIGAPVQVAWTREEDMKQGWYRPASLHILKGGLDASGQLAAMMHRMVSPSISGQREPDGGKGVDQSAMSGITNTQYAIPNYLVEYCRANTAVPVGYWRSVFNSQNGFVQESFIDELAHAAGKDPFEFRRAMLEKSPRLKGVLELAADKAGWGKPLPTGRFRGIASHFSFGAYCAQVAEISIENNQLRVHRVVCAVDVGVVLNPSMVEAQMEGSIVYGLTAALKGEINIENGRVKESNFHDYAMLRMNEMPVVDVHIMPSKETLSGAGEPGLPPAAPAVCNAIFAATGKRVRKLPIRLDQLA